MRQYPNKALVADVLGEVARLAVLEANADHPEDLGIAAVMAVEHAARTIQVLWKKELL